MDVSEFTAQVAGFDTLSVPDKLKLFAWYLHTHRKLATFGKPDIKQCFVDLNQVCPDLSIYFPRLLEQKAFLKEAGKVKLEGKLRAAIGVKYGDHPVVIPVHTTLRDLPAKVPDINERVFLSEVLDCYRTKSCRASIVMAWCLAMDHFQRWIFNDAARLSQFNATFATRFAKKAVAITKVEQFGDAMLDWEILEVAKSAGLITGDVMKVMKQKLDTRNSAAHPSTITFGELQASEYIATLVNEVVLKLV